MVCPIFLESAFLNEKIKSAQILISYLFALYIDTQNKHLVVFIIEMDIQSEFSILLSNIIDEKQYSHCRICLKFIEDYNFASFDDGVVSNDKYYNVHEVLTQILGKEACEEIPAINAVCSNCINKALETLNFIKLYQSCTLKLHRIFDNLNTSLVDINVSKSQKLYIQCYGEDDSKLIYVQNNDSEDAKPQRTCIQCSICNETFDNFYDLKEYDEEHQVANICVKCSYTSENIAKNKASLSSFKCKSCPVQRCTEESLQEHMDENHREHICKKCDKSYKSLDKLLKHEETHVSSYICSKCGKSYVTKPFFIKHVTLCFEDKVDLHPRRASLEKRYFCQECGKGYSAPGGLRVHKRFVHGNAKPHVCEECGKKFTAPCYLKVHMVTHTKEKKFPCNMCGGKFVSKEALLYHVRRHTGERPYSCDKCDEKFVNASARAEHMKFKHIGPTLRCELCSRMFVTKNFLRLHMKKHHDPANKLYIGRGSIPPNMPGEQNMRVRSL